MAKHVGRAGLAAAVWVAWAGMGAAGVTVVPGEKEYVRDLGGKWRFKLEQKAEAPAKGRIGGGPEKFVPPATLEAFEAEGYREGAEWKEITVPGNWEMQGWSYATFNQPNNEVGLYRLEFDVPREWEGRVVKVDFDGVQNGAEVYCNGRPVRVDEASQGRENYHQGGNTAFQADLTPVVKCGGKNVLAVRVYKNPEGVDLDTGDFFFLGGIHRKVTLFAVPRTHVEDLKVETKVRGEDGELRVVLAVEGGDGATVDVQLDGFEKSTAKVEAGKVEVVQKLAKPKLWSAEKPNLYTLAVDLKDASGKVVEHVTRRVGVREVSIEGGVLMVNHVPVKFTGMCRHENFAPLGTAMNEEVWRKDIEMMKAANVNAIRTSHYPYGAGFYDLCDELGMYVMDEMSAGWVATDTERLTPFFQQHAREMVRRDKNHPSVVVWAVGNENKKGFNNRKSADEIRKLDDTRPRLISWHDAEEGGGVELDDRHYTNPADILKANGETERRKTYPMIYLENPNDWEARNGADWGNLDLWGEIIKRTWDVVWDAEHVPGSFLWEWRDRAVADASEPKLFDYFPKSNTQLVKVKGQVDGWGNPRPSLFHVKMAYAPIKLDLTPAVRGDEVVVHARNYYSFTDVNELKATWQLLEGGKEIKGGEAKVSLAPRSKGDFKFELPHEEMRRADAMRVEFAAADGRNVATYVLRLKPEAAAAGPKLAGAEGVRFPRFNLVTVTYGKSEKTGWRQALRQRASLANVRVGGKAVEGAEKLALADVKDLAADVVIDGAVVGKLKAGYAGGKLKYRVEWVGAEKGDVQELGWVFERPAGEDRFSWKREGMWSWYPADHIGRLTGTARPDSADQDVSKITRADAFDWNSTKYACDWATLSGEEGKGLGVAFDASQRHQVRAGTGEDGGRELVVNRWCCPPRDLSSGIVPDLYFTLEKGKVVEGAFGVGVAVKE